MPTVVFIHDGRSIEYTPGADVAAGDVVVLGELVCVAKRPLPANTPGSLETEGVFSFPKATGVGTDLGAGVDVYWDEAEAVAKADAEAGANKHIGKTVVAAGESDEKVRCKLRA